MIRMMYCRVAGAVLAIAVLASAAPGGAPARWIPRGPGGGGAMFSPAFSPHSPDELYVNCDMSELFHTRDLGRSWETVDFRQIQGGNMQVYWPQFTADPAVLYAIDYTNDIRTPARSGDGGRTWRALATDPTWGEAFCLYADPAATNRVLTSDYGTIYFSTNSGVTFSPVYSASACHVAGVFFDSPRIYIGTQNGLVVSTNNGKSFAEVAASGIPAGQYPVTFTGAKEGATTRFFCVTLTGVWPGLLVYEEYGSYAGIYRMDYSASPAWTPVTGGMSADDTAYFVSMCRTNISIAYVAGVRTDLSFPVVCKTTNGGASWQRVLRTDNNDNAYTGWQGRYGDRDWWYGEIPMGFQVCPVDPRRAVMTDYGFVHLTTNGGATWSQAYVDPSDQNPTNVATPANRLYHSVGLEDTTCWGLTWVDPTNLFAGYTDIRGCRSTNGGVSWGFPVGLTYNSTYQAVKHPTSNILYAAASEVHDMYAWDRYCKDADLDAGTGAIVYSTNQATGWGPLHDFGHPVVGLAMDPTNSRRMLAAVVHSTQGGVFMTTNLQAGTGSTWAKLAVPAARTQGHPYQVRVLNDGTFVCAYSARINTILYTNFTDSSGVFVSTNNGVSWVDRSAPGMCYYTKDILVDPFDASQRRWYAGVWGEWGLSEDLGGLYMTTNRGVAWTRITSGLKSVESCTVNPANSNDLFVTTETQGLWISTNRYSANPAFTPVMEYPFKFPTRVIFNPWDTNEVWVLSFGNGMKVGRIVDPAPRIYDFNPAPTSTIRIAGAAGQELILQASTNLISWTGVATNRVLDNLLDFRDVFTSDLPTRFYRAKIRY